MMHGQKNIKLVDYSSALSLSWELDRAGGHYHAPAALPLGKTRYPLCRRLDGPQGRSERLRKISPPPPPGFDPQTLQRYTKCAVLASPAL